MHSEKVRSKVLTVKPEKVEKSGKTLISTNTKVKDARTERRTLAESDLEEFIKLVIPKRLLGTIHQRVIRWWTRQDAKNQQLVLLPRDHMKSALVAFRVAWELTKDPTLRILYISSTSNLATKQL